MSRVILPIEGAVAAPAAPRKDSDAAGTRHGAIPSPRYVGVGCVRRRQVIFVIVVRC